MLSIKGIDISQYQRGIDLESAKNQNFDIVYIKATEGRGLVDPLLSENYRKAKNNNFKIGFYHFLHSYDNGKKQAQFMYSHIKDLEFDCKIAIDIEITDDQTFETINNCIMEFATEMTSLINHEPIVYTYLSFANEYLSAELKKYDLWLADYNLHGPSPTKIWGNERIGWQYSDKGFFSVTTDLDLFDENIYISQKPEPPIPPTPETDFKVGDKVKIKSSATNYATGQKIPSWVKGTVYTISEIIDDKCLLKEITSWVYANDLEDSDIKPTPEEEINVGDIVRIKVSATEYATGEKIPSWVKNKPYGVWELIDDKILLKTIISWVYKSDVELVEDKPIPPTPETDFKVGDRVKIKSSATHYATGQAMPSWVKNRPYTIEETSANKSLLKEIISWVSNDDLEKI